MKYSEVPGCSRWASTDSVLSLLSSVMLESSRRIRQPKVEHFILIVPKRRAKRCLRHIFLCNANLVVFRLLIKRRKYLGTAQLIQYVINARQRVPVLDGVLVECTKSMHILREPSFFCTKRTGAPYGDVLGSIRPLDNSSSSCLFTSAVSA